MCENVILFLNAGGSIISRMGDKKGHLMVLREKRVRPLSANMPTFSEHGADL